MIVRLLEVRWKPGATFPSLIVQNDLLCDFICRVYVRQEKSSMLPDSYRCRICAEFRQNRACFRLESLYM